MLRKARSEDKASGYGSWKARRVGKAGGPSDSRAREADSTRKNTEQKPRRRSKGLIIRSALNLEPENQKRAPPTISRFPCFAGSQTPRTSPHQRPGPRKEAQPSKPSPPHANFFFKRPWNPPVPMPPRLHASPAHARDAARLSPSHAALALQRPTATCSVSKRTLQRTVPSDASARAWWKRYAGRSKAWGRSSPDSSGPPCCGFSWTTGTTEDVRSKSVLEGGRVMPGNMELVLLRDVEF